MLAGLAALLALITLSGCATPSSAKAGSAPVPKPPEEVFPVPETLYDTKAFTEKVLGQGGRVDFVFADKRPFAQCHASTITQPAPGVLLAAWFGGTEEKDPDVGIWFARFADGVW